MFIRKKKVEALVAEYERLITKLREDNIELSRLHRHDVGQIRSENVTLERMNARLQSDLDWAKLRLNAVEKERAQLIAAAIGVKISIPEFVPKMDNLEDVLNQVPDLSTVGNDAKEDNTDVARTLGQELAIDYSLMPGYRGK